MIFGLHEEPIEVTISRLEREALARVQVTIAARQLGEAFVGLDDRRDVLSKSRGVDRRKAA